MKSWLLQFQISKLKKNKLERSNTEFQKSKTIGFLFDNIQQFKESKPLIDNLKHNHIKIHSIVYYKPKKDEKVSFDFFNKDDLNFVGKIKSKKLLDFTNEKFDFLFYFGGNFNKLTEYIMLKTPASCRVGYHKDGFELYFDLMFDKKMSKDSIINKIKDIKVNG